MSPQSRYRTGGHELVRQMNLSVVMHHLRDNPSTSRATLAEMTGLNKTTVSSLVQELIERRFVHEVGLESGGTGRPARLLELNPGAGHIVSCEIGVDFISVVCTDFAPDIIWRHQESIDPTDGKRAIIDRALISLRKAVNAGNASGGTVLGLGVGVPGLVDQASGTLLFAPNLGWRDVPLGTLLQDSLDAPIFVGNEANMAALGEHYFGAARGYDEVLYISAGVGLGGGLVHGGRVFNGVTGFAGEFGHITMDPEGELCNCGNRGCWETQVSQQALFRHVRQAIKEGQSSKLSEMNGSTLERLTVPMVAEAAHDGDAVALEALSQVGSHLGIGIASLVNVLNPELVVFGGILSVAGEFLLPAVNEELQRRALRWNREATEVVLAEHGFDACVMGGVAMVYQAILAEPNSAALQSI
ncbi:MAG: ROK family transcriptional regulator [Anaerolineae bacterium]|jgi:glucokinase-like ROK family protein